MILGLFSAIARRQDVAGVPDRDADIAVGQLIDVFKRTELPDVGADVIQQRRGFCDIVGIVAVGIEAQIIKRSGQNIVWRVLRNIFRNP